MTSPRDGSVPACRVRNSARSRVGRCMSCEFLVGIVSAQFALAVQKSKSTGWASCVSFILLYAHSITQAQRKRPQHQSVIAVDSRAETTTRLDLSDHCFVDDLVSLLFLVAKSQLARFAEMVSQVRETGRLRVNKSILAV